MRALLPTDYKPLFNNDFLFYVYYGGRGAGKTENVAQALVLLAASSRKRILCIRESQSSLSESVKSTIEAWIDKLNLHDKFRILNSTIQGVNGSEFIFMGMRSHNAVNVKSISNIDITWIEEAEAFSQRSWDLLVPSVIRTSDPKIIITFNPYKEDDTIYKEFCLNNPPARSLVKKVNYDSNPFFKGSYLELQREDDLKRLPTSVYEHKWLGQIAKEIESSLFYGCDFSPVGSEDFYEKIVIACDPATTNKHFSNEYGIIVCAQTFSGEFRVLNDYSGNMSPIDFAKTVNLASREYKTKDVVVEVNNGGDFIKAILLEHDPTLIVHEVRATKDKSTRASPVANLMSLGNIRFEQTLPKLKRQLELLTNKGFLGSLGESPDRADAFVWGIYHLAGITDKDSIWTVFKQQWLKADVSYTNKAIMRNSNIAFISCIGLEWLMLKLNAWEYLGDFRLEFVDCDIYENLDKLLEDSDQTPRAVQSRICLNNAIVKLSPLTESLGLRSFEAENLKIEDKINKCLPVLTHNKTWLSGLSSKLLENLRNFSYEKQNVIESSIAELFCDIIILELL